MDVKARSKAMREILTRLQEIEGQGVEIRIFGDKVILDEGKSEVCLVFRWVGRKEGREGKGGRER